jgi:hypothetical protein
MAAATRMTRTIRICFQAAIGTPVSGGFHVHRRSSEYRAATTAKRRKLARSIYMIIQRALSTLNIGNPMRGNGGRRITND